ncbi:hypothetical protein BU23DRAFT_573160 [Bimuria novae-zelandiae CBS 107.79]|uniref:Uncharacterized protein n=1 Tax=Bimuria novae-zelandiae CBS 107.79 TaxID=1447943 RepID=A0A6A5USN5_9PLEO|nr:hypothetical protein BU23DRAFT_573160 [Bimuria novae-zelandiae CBS 107.79]
MADAAEVHQLGPDDPIESFTFESILVSTQLIRLYDGQDSTAAYEDNSTVWPVTVKKRSVLWGVLNALMNAASAYSALYELIDRERTNQIKPVLTRFPNFHDTTADLESYKNKDRDANDCIPVILQSYYLTCAALAWKKETPKNRKLNQNSQNAPSCHGTTQDPVLGNVTVGLNGPTVSDSGKGMAVRTPASISVPSPSTVSAGSNTDNLPSMPEFPNLDIFLSN